MEPDHTICSHHRVPAVWLVLIGLALIAVAPVSAEENWSPVIVPRGEYRETLQAIPIPDRPGRPLHVYGNTVRYVTAPPGSVCRQRPVRQILLGTPYPARVILR